MKTSSEFAASKPCDWPQPEPTLSHDMYTFRVAPQIAPEPDAQMNFAEHAAPAQPAARFMPSGVHRIELKHAIEAQQNAAEQVPWDAAEQAPWGEQLDANDNARPMRQITEGSTVQRSRSALPRLAKAPRINLFASTNVAVAVSVIALAARWFVHNPWACALVSLSPIWLLLWHEQRAKRALYAGMLWLGLAFTQLLHPVEEAGARLHDLLSLFVLAMILLSLRHAYSGIQELSRRDPLTGLLNRRGLEELGTIELQRAARYGRPIAFALFDVDRFKQINDSFGHATGDRVLQVVAAQLRELRNSDLAVRLGGDEFGLLMPETDREGAELLVARLRQRVHEQMHLHGWPVTISVGIADSQPRVRQLDALIAEADHHMYESKVHVHTAAQ